MILEAALALSFYTIPACRWLDTRIPGCVTGAGRMCAQGPMVNGEMRNYLIQASALCPMGDTSARPIPLGAKVLIVNVTATEPTGTGNLLLFDATAPAPVVSSLNFQPGRTVANLVFVNLGQQMGLEPGTEIMPDLAIRAQLPQGGSVHVVVDFVGYMAE